MRFMDKKTEKELKQITRRIPKNLQGDVTKTVVDTSEEQVIDQVIHDPKTTTEQREKLKRFRDSGMFRKESVVVDEKKVRELDRYHEKEVKKAISDGRIPPPDTDPFIRERNKRLQERQ